MFGRFADRDALELDRFECYGVGPGRDRTAGGAARLPGLPLRLHHSSFPAVSLSQRSDFAAFSCFGGWATLANASPKWVPASSLFSLPAASSGVRSDD